MLCAAATVKRVHMRLWSSPLPFCCLCLTCDIYHGSVHHMKALYLWSMLPIWRFLTALKDNIFVTFYCLNGGLATFWTPSSNKIKPSILKIENLANLELLRGDFTFRCVGNTAIGILLRVVHFVWGNVSVWRCSVFSESYCVSLSYCVCHNALHVCT
mgnify:CR=1 FL=1